MKLIPAEVATWDGAVMRVHIPGYTDHAEIYPKAEVCFPLADLPSYTGYRIESGDPIWVMFNDGDVNSPIVMGFRHKHTGESKDIRRFRHVNFEAHAENQMQQTSTQHTIRATSLFEVTGNQIVLKGNIRLDGPVTISGALSANGGGTMKGNMTINGALSTSGNITSGGSISDKDGDGGA